MLKSLIDRLQVIETSGALPGSAVGVTQDSRRAAPGYIFAARSGRAARGMNYLSDAAAAGAVMVVTDEPIPKDAPLPGIQVADFRQALGILSRELFGNPSHKLNLIGVTGTNGKTSTVHLIRSIIEATGERCGMISTVGYYTGKRNVAATLTTPDIDQLNELLAEMEGAGCLWAAIEVSSHALAQGRALGLRFQAAAFTNLSLDHLDYHGSMENYARTKMKLFEMLPAGAVAVANIGSPWGKSMLGVCAESRRISIGPEGSGADVRFHCTSESLDGIELSLHSIQGELSLRSPLVGAYQAENIAAAAGIALGLGFPVAAIQIGVEAVRGVPGRMERVLCARGFHIFVDYSHTPEALNCALQSLRPLCKGQLFVVFGCGGDRDRSKRPLMGRAASELADRIMVTSDNPRSEDPMSIINQIVAGVGSHSNLTAQPDRRTAIRAAIRMAGTGDVLLIAGKGHETDQEISGVRTDFDDRVVAAEVLAALPRMKAE